jgi:hypothetical protein
MEVSFLCYFKLCISVIILFRLHGRLLRNLLPALYAVLWEHERLVVHLWKQYLQLVLAPCMAEFIRKCNNAIYQ